MKFIVKTKGHNDIIDITGQVEKIVDNANIKDGIALIFIPSSTTAITAMEYEEGVIKDLQKVLEEIAPAGFDYEHHKKWGDRNGAAHIKSALFKPSLCVPIEGRKLILGTWQQIVLIDFDERGREREVIVRAVSTQA